MKSRNAIQTRVFVLLFVMTSLFSASSCSDDTAPEDDDEVTVPTDDDFETNSQEVFYDNAVTVAYSGTAVTVTNPFAGSGITTAVDGSNVVITSTVTDTEINYVLSGVSAEGSFKLYSDYKFNLILNGVAITNDDGPAINIQSGKKVSVIVLDQTHNRLIDGTGYTSSDEDQKGTFFSEGQLVFSGTGSLGIYGNYKHAIASDDYISITEGNITIASAASDGIHANDYFKMSAGSVTIVSSGDGIDAEEGYIEISGGTITVTSMDDGITASYEGDDSAIIPYVQITGGVINITSSGEKGNAIKSEGDITINSIGEITLATSGKGGKGFTCGGDFTLTDGDISVTTTGTAFYDTEDADIATAAGINADGNLIIEGGALTITSSGAGGKGISVDGTLTVDGGTTSLTASGAVFSYSGESYEAKGIKSDGAVVINNGSLTISAADDGIKSETSITTTGGSIVITKSTEGIEAPLITFNNGSISVVSSDDCVNSTYGLGGESNDNSLITFAGGVLALNSTGGDAVDGNGNIIMTGGTVIVQGPPSSPEVALDYNGTFKISGGLLIGSGPNSGNMIEATSTSSDQFTALIKINGNVPANTVFNVQDAAGNSLITYKPVRAAYYFIFSSSALQSGSAYKVYTGGSVTGGATTNGMVTGGTYSGGTLEGSFTVNSKVTTVLL
jgi:hypothetical protein